MPEHYEFQKAYFPYFSYFPMMINIINKKVLIVGGGKIASRRAVTLLKCGAEVICVSPNFCDEFPENTTKIFRTFKPDDLNEIFLVTAATDNRSVNHYVAVEAKKRNILVNIADCKSECDFYFPSLINSKIKPYIAVSVCSAGISTAITKKLSDKLRNIWDSWVQEFIDS